jgi:ureidoglycolate hydrolase
MTAQPRRATPDAFARFGAVVPAPTQAPTASDDTFKYWSDLAHYGIEGETEIGLCTVYRQDAPRVTWMERHDRTPEFLVPADGPFLLPVMDAAGAVEVFRVEQGEAVVIGQGVWHSACLPVEGDAATYFVVFRRGTPREDVTKQDITPLSVEG